MKIKKIDKSVMQNENLDLPPKSVLDSAVSDMQERKQKRLPLSKIFAIAVPSLMVIIVVCCIPLMLPAAKSNSAPNLGSDWFWGEAPNGVPSLNRVEIDSIEEFNADSDRNVLTFGEPIPNSSWAYALNNFYEYFQESYQYNDNLIIKSLVESKPSGGYQSASSTNYYPQLDKNFLSNMTDKQTVQLDKCNVTYSIESNNHLFVTFHYKDYFYMIEMQGDISLWENILNDFIK
ncbi:MAG: hypothetical protein K2J16_00030 [Clostridia bacterium]|nr:hypothetical protein [Clostridia bacterium]